MIRSARMAGKGLIKFRNAPWSPDIMRLWKVIDKTLKSLCVHRSLNPQSDTTKILNFNLRKAQSELCAKIQDTLSTCEKHLKEKHQRS